MSQPRNLTWARATQLVLIPRLCMWCLRPMQARLVENRTKSRHGDIAGHQLRYTCDWEGMGEILLVDPPVPPLPHAP